jgi:hypothetical protein
VASLAKSERRRVDAKARLALEEGLGQPGRGDGLVHALPGPRGEGGLERPELGEVPLRAEHPGHLAEVRPRPAAYQHHRDQAAGQEVEGPDPGVGEAPVGAAQ